MSLRVDGIKQAKRWTDLIYRAAALDVGGLLAREVWGQQWVRLLALMYEGVTVGYHGQQGRLIGGKSPEGIAARVRVQLEIERIMSAF